MPVASPGAATTPQPIAKPRMLLGEGLDEVRFLSALLEHRGRTGIQVEEYGGKQKLDAFIEALLVRPGFGKLLSLGITRDADNSAVGAFQSVTHLLAKHGLLVPTAPNQPATGPPTTIAFIFPGGK